MGKDPLFFNKVASSVLGALLLIIGGSILLDEMLSPHADHSDVYVPAEPLDEGASAGTALADQGLSSEALAAMLTVANPQNGPKVIKRCLACHTFDQGEAHRVGPNLYSILGDSIGAKDGFNYSAAIGDYASQEERWTPEILFRFLQKPRTVIKGTTMGFAGLKKPEDIADLIAHLNQDYSETPLDFSAP